MIWVLGEILLFLILAFVLGVACGWLVWRWRRRSVSAESWNALSSATKDARNELDTLRQADERLSAERNEMRRRVAVLETELDATINSLEESTERNDLVTTELEAAQQRVDDLTNELQRVRARAVVLDRDLTDTRTKVAELVVHEAESKQLKTELHKRDERVADLQKTLGHAELEVERLRDAQSVAASAALADLSASDPDGAMARIADLDALLAVARTERDTGRERISGLEADLVEAQAQLMGMSLIEADAARLRADLDSANVRIGELAAQVSEAEKLRVNLGKARSSIAMLQGDLRARIEDANAVRGRLDTANDRIVELEGDLRTAARSREELDQARDDITELEIELRRRVDEARRIRFDLNTAHRRLAELELELAENTSRLLELDDPALSSERLAAAEIAIADLETAREHIAKLERELAESDLTEADLLAAHARIADLEAELRTSARPRRPEPDVGAADTPSRLVAESHGDDLTVIKGIGAVIEAQLNDLGIHTWDQLAAMSDERLAEVEDSIDVPAPIDAASWVLQASRFVARYPDSGSRPDRKTYRRTTGSKDRIRPV